MTREEFEYAIKSCGCFIYRGQTYYEESEMMKAFEDMGLIEQEQSGDLIQRQDDRGVSLKSVKHILYDVCLHEDNMALFSKLLDRVNKLRDWEEYLTIKQEPCEDAISRQAVIDAIYDMEILKYRIDLENVIKALPPIKPQEKTGHWIYKTMEGQFCSICGEQSVWKFNYCPNCGARMVEEQESEVQDADSN